MSEKINSKNNRLLSTAIVIFLASLMTILASMANANAVPIQLDFSVENNSGEPGADAIVPAGTPIIGNILFDVSAGTPADIFSLPVISGELTFNNGGMQSIIIDDAFISGATVGLTSSFLTVGLSFEMEQFGLTGLSVVFEILENPFSSTMELSDILLTQATVTELILSVPNASGVGPAFFNGNPTSTFSLGVVPPAEVPLPAAAWMFLVGVGGLGAAKKRRSIARR